MKKITNPNDIKVGMTLLLIDEDQKIRGIDEIVRIKKCMNTGANIYDYLSYKAVGSVSNIYNISSEKVFKDYTVYSVDKDFAKRYSDEKLHEAWLSFDLGEVFSYVLYSESEGRIISKFISYAVRNNIKARLQFIDITNNYEETLNLLRFTDTENDVDPVIVSKLKNDLGLLVDSLV